MLMELIRIACGVEFTLIKYLLKKNKILTYFYNKGKNWSQQ